MIAQIPTFVCTFVRKDKIGLKTYACRDGPTLVPVVVVKSLFVSPLLLLSLLLTLLLVTSLGKS